MERMSTFRRDKLYMDLKAVLVPMIREGGRDTVADLLSIAHAVLLDSGDTDGAKQLATATYQMFGK